MTVKRSDSEYVVERRRTFDGPVVETVTRAGNQLTITSGDGVVVAKGRRAAEGTWYRGAIRLAASTTAGTFDVVNDVRLEDYLRGVVPRESPASWPIEALKAQAVAARSYVLAEGRRGHNFDTCDTTACQVYGGRATVAWDGRVTWAKESSRTSRAIGETAGEVRMYGGAVAFTQFSSTNGGYSRQGSKPYLVARPDPYTGTATGDTRTRWTDTLAVSTVQAKCPSGGRLLNLVIVRRDGNGELGGRITEARVECTTGSRTLTSTGDLAFGMFSHWWRPVDQPGTFYLNDTWSGTANIEFRHGMPADEVYVGDWDGDGIDTVALRRGHIFSVRNSNTPGPADTTFGYGRPGDTVLVGDWDGDGTDTLAVRRGSFYHIKNSVSAGEADLIVPYGRAGDEVLVGDWDGDGDDTLTVRRGNAYYVKNTIAGGEADQVVHYGRSGDVTLAGDWDGDGNDTFAVRRGHIYHVKNTMSGGEADIVQPYGRPSDEVYVGDWNGDRRDTLGVYRRA
ncbi:SpoIID/LytB domain-containing protein [Georgenia halophila]|uniref:SpoIID/LytB domain-containing protein n=1 Tax=Georgenia halophila TaxID=620889 RepID=UPI0031EBF396